MHISKDLIQTFLRYFGVGIFNTLVHWAVFYMVFSQCALQSVANIVAFAVAVVVSYILNSRFTFKQGLTGKKFVLFTSFMGAIALGSGAVADSLGIYPLLTLIFTSGFSLVAGFLFSRFVVFKD